MLKWVVNNYFPYVAKLIDHGVYRNLYAGPA